MVNKKKIDHKRHIIFSNVNVSDNEGIKCNKNNVMGGAVSPKTCHVLNLPNVAVYIALYQTNPNTDNSGQFVLLSQISSFNFITSR